MERTYKALFKATRDAIFLMQGDRFIDCNPATLEMFSCTRKQIIGKSPVQLSPMTQPDGSKSETLLQQKIDSAYAGKAQQFEWNHVRLDGTSFVAEVSLNFVSLSGDPYLLSIVRDISDRKLAEENAAEQTALLHSWFNAVPGITFMCDVEGNLVLWNQQFVDLFGVNPKGQLKHHFLTYVAPEAHEDVREFFGRILATSLPQSLEVPLVSRGGGKTQMLIRADKFDKHTQSFVVGVAVDVTERVRAEREALHQKESLRKLTRRLIQSYEDERRHLSRELHDELGQSLTAIRADAVYISNRTRDQYPDLFDRAQAILNISGRNYDIARAIMKRLRPGVLYELGLVAAIEDLLEEARLAQPDLYYSLDSKGEYSDLDEEVSLSLYRTVQECLTNIAKHSTASRVNIQLRRAQNNARGYPEQEMITLCVQDNGAGGDFNHNEHKKDSFGLAGIRERAEGLGGTFNIQNIDGKGVIVDVKIPINTKSVDMNKKQKQHST